MYYILWRRANSTRDEAVTSLAILGALWRGGGPLSQRWLRAAKCFCGSVEDFHNAVRGTHVRTREDFDVPSLGITPREKTTLRVENSTRTRASKIGFPADTASRCVVSLSVRYFIRVGRLGASIPKLGSVRTRVPWP